MFRPDVTLRTGNGKRIIEHGRDFITAIEVFNEYYKGDFEDYLFFQRSQILRQCFPHGAYKILIHVHDQKLMAMSCVLQAVYGGADGIWAGLSHVVVQVGHASTAHFHWNLLKAIYHSLNTY